MNLQDRYEAVLERVAAAAQRANRNPSDISLVAVSKTWPVETILAAYELGMRHFGENRAEELADKQVAVREHLGPGHDLKWHAIGNLQSRKTQYVADCADFFHALDRFKIASRLSRQLAENGRALPVLLEVNVSGESSKAGLVANHWEEDEGQRRELVREAAAVLQLPHLQLRGLMTMAPWDAPQTVIRTIFRRTHALAEWLQSQLPQANLTTLSMGMTDDFEIAIEEGATHIRVGRAIFGDRQY